MNSRVHPKYKTKYRVGNWREYERALVRRGDVTFWLSADAIAAWKPAPSGRRGAQRKFSDCAIETALTLRLVFRLPLRQAEGFLRSVLSMMRVDLDAPDHRKRVWRSQRLSRGHALSRVSFHLDAYGPDEAQQFAAESRHHDLFGFPSGCREAGELTHPGYDGHRRDQRNTGPKR